MSDAPIPILIKAVMPGANGYAMFLGNEHKTFVIHIDPIIADAIKHAINEEKKERPLIHDLFANLLTGLGAEISHVIINHAENGIYFARLFVQMKNELGQKIIELDARPSDSLLLSIKRKRPIYVAKSVLDAAEDMTELLEHLKEAEAADNNDDDDDAPPPF